jgi:xanthine dehydrogenase accessory factor
VKEVLPDIERWRARGERFAVATVIATRRSAPRPVGAKFAVSETGEMAGSVSGGCVESDVYDHACQVLEGASPQFLSYGIADELAFSVGLPCGGEIDVFVETAPDALVEQLLQIIETEERAILFTVVEGEPLGADLLVTEAGERFGDGPGELPDHVDELLRRGRNTLLELDDGRKVFAEIYGPAPRLLVIGAVDTAEALCAAAKQLGWRTIVADARGKFATKERIPSADELLGTEAFYIGALGSRRNQERRRERLLEAGVEEHQFERVSGPTGLDIGADSPAETALSILGEILATRAGRDGGFLRNSKTRIHVEEPRESADALARD